MRHPSRNVNYTVYETELRSGKSAPLEQALVRLLGIVTVFWEGEHNTKCCNDPTELVPGSVKIRC
jgi:hypothetical protein